MNTTTKPDKCANPFPLEKLKIQASANDNLNVLINAIRLKYVKHAYFAQYLFGGKRTWSSCSKLTTSLVNVSFKFQTLISEIRRYFC